MTRQRNLKIYICKNNLMSIDFIASVYELFDNPLYISYCKHPFPKGTTCRYPEYLTDRGEGCMARAI